MRALSGFVICACAAVATAFSPMQQEDPFGGRPRAMAIPAPAAPLPPAAPVGISGNASTINSQNGLTTAPGQNLRSRYYYRYGGNATTKAERKLTAKIGDLKKKLASDDAEVREAAEGELEGAVGELFDMRTNTRKEQIKDLEKRIATLRKQLEKREDNKSEIVRLHVKTMVNESKGLGF